MTLDTHISINILRPKINNDILAILDSARNKLIHCFEPGAYSSEADLKTLDRPTMEMEYYNGPFILYEANTQNASGSIGIIVSRGESNAGIHNHYGVYGNNNNGTSISNTTFETVNSMGEITQQFTSTKYTNAEGTEITQEKYNQLNSISKAGSNIQREGGFGKWAWDLLSSARWYRKALRRWGLP